MLKVNQSTAASDIWALGCIIFKMLSGREPFQGSTDYYTFQMILERKLTFTPEDSINSEAKDLIDQLL
jgi:3-phosphoinositide dependent protein kinase-1